MPATSSSTPVTLIGAGLTGSLLATLLAKQGFQVRVFERRQDLRKTSVAAGRSINLAISLRGIDALRRVQLDEKVLAAALPMGGRMIHSPTGGSHFQPYGPRNQDVINSISRTHLNHILMDGAEATGQVEILFEQKVEHYDFDRRELSLVDRSGRRQSIKAPLVIAADGAGSAVRQAMTRLPHFTEAVDFLEHGYKEMTIPPAADGNFKIAKNALHIWPREKFMLIALPNPDGSFTCTLFLPGEGGSASFAALDRPEAIDHFFQTNFADVTQLSDSFIDEIINNPLGRLGTVRCEPWAHKGQCLLIGDAAHGIVPFYGQGMNCGFESCVKLIDELQRGGSWEDVFRRYQEQRKRNADAIADLALANFIEMRDLVAHPQFQLKKKIARRLEQDYPDRFASQYSMVTFSQMDYAYAQACGQLQEAVLNQLSEGAHAEADVDWSRAPALLSEYDEKVKKLQL